MGTEEIIAIIVGILASIGLTICIVGALYCTYSVIVVDRNLKRDLKRIEDELAKSEKEE